MCKFLSILPIEVDERGIAFNTSFPGVPVRVLRLVFQMLYAWIKLKGGQSSITLSCPGL